ncbi:MAG: methylenetetrahydrofolate reductase [Lachnospiraceae bacterium]|nr:methylenetetrahydrofolate reductase [NAD(P)H] [Lachnospiraceae bacterium]
MIKDLSYSNGSVLSCEIFPPKKEAGFPKVFEVIDRIAALNPAFISVTYGAGGSNSGKQLEIVDYIQNKKKIEALAHITSVGYDKNALEAGLKNFEDKGIYNVLALRGDRPKDMTDEQYDSREFEHATDMVKYMRSTGRTNDKLCIAGACYPEKHSEAPDKLTDIFHLKEKQNAGTDFFISQLFFENTLFYRFLDLAEKNGIEIPIHAGIMPITDSNQLGRTVTLSGTSVPKKLADICARYGDDPEDMKKAGIEYAVNQAVDLMTYGVSGIHVYAMNKPELCEAIFEAVR